MIPRALLFAIAEELRYRGNMAATVKTARLSNGLKMDALGARLRQERVVRKFSLDALADKAGVSRSMVSEVERGTKVPSVIVLDRIATALDTSIARLLDEEQASAAILIRRDEQHVIREFSGWERRILSPVLPGIEFEFMRTTIGSLVDAGAFSPHAPGSREYLAMESGTLLLTIDGVQYKLGAGDSIYYAGDCVHSFKNPAKVPCIYYMAMDVTPGMTAISPGRRSHSRKERRIHGR
jgi:XRE family transcriptional regulator, regulator of sulfur utilization